MTAVMIIAGLVLLTIGAEALIRGAASLARRFGLSELLIGLTLVGFGTSTPELVSSVQAAQAGAPDIAVGNVIGSNIANILLILGLTALIAPVAVEPKSFGRDAPALAAATIIAILVAMTGEFGRLAGAGFLIAIAAYIAFAYLTERRAPANPETQRHEAEAGEIAGRDSPLLAILFAAVGLALLIAGAKLLVTGSIALAVKFNVPEAVIGLTVVAVGTSLPELVTSVMAALRGKGDLALGNVVGSNIYNLLGILGVTALIKPVSVAPQLMQIDVWVMLAATAAMIFFARTQRRIDRWEGGALTAGYAAYTIWLISIA